MLSRHKLAATRRTLPTITAPFPTGAPAWTKQQGPLRPFVDELKNAPPRVAPVAPPAPSPVAEAGNLVAHALSRPNPVSSSGRNVYASELAKFAGYVRRGIGYK